MGHAVCPGWDVRRVLALNLDCRRFALRFWPGTALRRVSGADETASDAVTAYSRDIKKSASATPPKKGIYDESSLTFRFGLVTLLFAFPAGKAACLGPIAKVALSLLGIRMN